MLRFLFRRLVLAILVCVTVLVVAFALTRLSGDVAVAIAGPQATPADIATIRRTNGLDRPLPIQFAHWAAAAATGDLGRSFLYRAPVGQLVRQRLPVTLTLGCAALAIALLVAMPLGIAAAMVEGTLLGPRAHDSRTVRPSGAVLLARGCCLIIWVGLDLGWLPINGLDDWTGYVLPAITLAFSAIPAMMRLTRSGMVDALRADYIRTARAKGLSRLSIVGKHALRNAAMPLVAIAAVQLGFMLGGSIVVESVFNLPGLGYLAWESISKNDYPVVQAVVLILAVIYVALTLAADLLNAALDPRAARRMSKGLGLLILVFAVLAAAFGPSLAGHDPYTQDLSHRLIPPAWMGGSAAHWLGTDQLGRDYLARLVTGTRISLLIGAVTVAVSGTIGVTLGMVGGFFGGLADEVVMFAITCRLAIPIILVALTAVAFVGSSLTVVVLTLGLLLWDRFAVVARTTTLQVRNLDYVSAARAAGASLPHILLHEVLPNIAPALVIVATLEAALAILLEAVLSFLGLGVPPPLPSWGLMIAEGRGLHVLFALGDHGAGSGAVRAGAGHQPAGRRAAAVVSRCWR